MDPQEEPGGAWAPLILRPNWGLRGWKKIFLEPPPLSQGLDSTGSASDWMKQNQKHYPCHIITKKFLRMFLRHHFAGNCGCATNCWLFSSMKVKESGVYVLMNISCSKKKHAKQMSISRVFQTLIPIVNCILQKAFNASLGKCKLIQVRNLYK